jgi:hypothetical protein
VTVIEAEAVIVREVYARCLEGASPGEIARELNDRGVLTGSGKAWQPYAVRSVLDSRHVTGIRVFRGQDAGEGDWPAIIDRGAWAEVQERRAYRSSAHDRRGWRFYLLRGLVVCKKCGWRMAGSTSKDACYMCAKHTYLGPERCHRRIGAARLEEFVTDAAVDLLTHLDVSGAPSAATALSAGDEAVISADEAELAELKDMWTHRELSTREYRATLQRFLNLSPWDADALLDVNREYAMENLADPGGILVADETGFATTTPAGSPRLLST